MTEDLRELARQLARLAELFSSVGDLAETEVGHRWRLVHDPGVSATPLFYRLDLSNGGRVLGSFDLGIEPRLGTPLLAFRRGVWNPDSDEEQVLAQLGYGEWRCQWVAHDYPLVGLQAVLGTERRRFELIGESWRESAEWSGGNWSLLDELPGETAESRSEGYAKSLQVLVGWARALSREPNLAAREEFLARTKRERVFVAHDGCIPGCGCLDLFVQPPFWCTAACVEMLLKFHICEATIPVDEIARNLGLGTVKSPHVLPAGSEGAVPSALIAFSNATLDARLCAFTRLGDLHCVEGRDFIELLRREIPAARPLILLYGAHASVIAGFSGVSDPSSNYSMSHLILLNPAPGSGIEEVTFPIANHRFVVIAAPVPEPA
jgi:hypothetical protein